MDDASRGGRLDDAPARRSVRTPFRTVLRAFERTLGSGLFAGIVLLPLLAMVARWEATGALGASLADLLVGSQSVVPHLVLWLAFVGAARAAAEGRLLALHTGSLLPAGRGRGGVRALAALTGAGATALLARAGWEFLVVERSFGDTVAWGVPVWVALLVLPIALAVVAVRLVWVERGSARWAGAAGLALGLVLGQAPGLVESAPLVLVLGIAGLALAAGAPIFAVLGGVAVLLFARDGIPIAAVPIETYRLATSPTLPAIPLFTLTGFLLAEGAASERLVGVFRALFGWLPGGTAVATALVCAFFTVFTGGSGVTILALGGLLMATLQADGYGERFSLGLLTGSGSLGLLLPPALPLILYGIVAQVPIEDLFRGGALPGLLMVAMVAAWGVREGLRVEGARPAAEAGDATSERCATLEARARPPFESATALRALWRAKWELALPAFLVGSILGGFATAVEASALAVVWALVAQCVVHRDLAWRDLPRVVGEAVVLVGGVLVILCVAMGLTSYLVDAQVPSALLEWMQNHVESPLVFLLLLNLFLLAVGCLMDIFSATVVVVPILVPLGAAYGIDPVHLGILFLANLELGYLTPPVGLNLFLSAYRFERPLLTVWRAALPMFVILGVAVLFITYVPWLTTALLDR